MHLCWIYACVCIQKRGKTQGKTLGGPIDPLRGAHYKRYGLVIKHVLR